MEGLTVRVPGKLLLAGEYAILEPGSLALVLAVNRYLNVRWVAAEQYSLNSDLLAETWFYTPDKLPEAPAHLRFAAAALALGWQYLQPQLAELPPFALEISSQLHKEGAKVGLGSSAAVVVGVLATLLAVTGHNLEDKETRQKIFKLALLAHRSVQGSGSGADLAGCIYGSVTAYASPDFGRIPFQLPLEKLLATDWPMLRLEKLNWPSDWGPLHFGWTSVTAETGSLIQHYQVWQREQPEA